ncbi:MAG: three-Cys-motif partner protein TcmP [Deltaproteobacteria bacterium]|nr:three-Cys-motif partner protein TcmP [Deltaproteobacteria bacterium]
MDNGLQKFGGDWTTEKLLRIQKYLSAYTTALKNKPFRLIYIDAFAGTGYRNIKSEENQQTLMFPDLAAEDTEAFLAGSAKIALQTEPRFAEYHFIEQDARKCKELERLKQDFPAKAQDIHIDNDDANAALVRICDLMSKRRNLRAVLFLDPFGMNVSWQTIEAIAATKAIDMWYLFPLGVGVNRLLTKNGIIPDTWQQKLNNIFGCSDWKEQFYTTEIQQDLFSDEETSTKTGDFQQIADFFVRRLDSIFAGVVKKPLPLYNSRRNPLYLLCFACGNKKGTPIALRIAGHILKG